MMFLRYHLPVILYAGLIFISSSISTIPQQLPEFSFRDKLIHIVEFFIFGCLLWRSVFQWSLAKNVSKVLILSMLLGAFYAATDEIHQRFVPGRDGNFYDWLADIIGLAIAVVTSYIFSKERGLLDNMND